MNALQTTKISALAFGILLLTLSISGVATASNNPKREFFAGAGFICSISSTFCPDVATAANGDTVTLAGTGWFINNPSSRAMGSGSFVHRDSSGNILGFGTWTALELVSFTPGGFSTLGGVLPQGSEGGSAVIKVHISPATGGAGFTALLTVNCALATAGVDEGIHLDVIGGPSFDTSSGGNTLFVQP